MYSITILCYNTYMTDPSQYKLIGYHGTSEDSAARILTEGFSREQLAWFALEGHLGIALFSANNKVELARYEGIRLKPALVEVLLPDLGISDPAEQRMTAVLPERVGEIVVVNMMAGDA